MADILHDLTIGVAPAEVFRAISTPAGLDRWWTKRSSGEPRRGQIYELWFSPEHDWRGRVTRCVPNTEFELEVTEADEDWTGTRVGFRLAESGPGTVVSFYHTGWTAPNSHFRQSSYCWATYLRILKHYLEGGEAVAYEDRSGV
jgi:uncharacterized protein YndB with AHSA1/START domain